MHVCFDRIMMVSICWNAWMQYSARKLFNSVAMRTLFSLVMISELKPHEKVSQIFSSLSLPWIANYYFSQHNYDGCFQFLLWNSGFQHQLMLKNIRETYCGSCRNRMVLIQEPYKGFTKILLGPLKFITIFPIIYEYWSMSIFIDRNADLLIFSCPVDWKFTSIFTRIRIFPFVKNTSS